MNVLNIDSEVCDILIELMSKYSLSHNLTLPDAMIAATAISNNIPLYTLNKKDFKFIVGMKLVK